MRSLLLLVLVIMTGSVSGARPVVSPALAVSPPSIQQIYIDADPSFPRTPPPPLDRLKLAPPYP